LNPKNIAHRKAEEEAVATRMSSTVNVGAENMLTKMHVIEDNEKGD